MARVLADVFAAFFQERARALADIVVGGGRLRLHFLAEGRGLHLECIRQFARLFPGVVRNFADLRFELFQLSACLVMKFREHLIEMLRGHVQLPAEVGEQLFALAFDVGEIVIGELAVAFLELAFDCVPVAADGEVFHASEFAEWSPAGRMNRQPILDFFVKKWLRDPDALRRHAFDTRSRTPRRDTLFAMAKKTKTPLPPIESIMQRADDFARREPAKAVVSGFGAGFLLNLLPLRMIASMLVTIVFSCLRPALLFLGLMKACEFCRTNKPPTDHHE